MSCRRRARRGMGGGGGGGGGGRWGGGGGGGGWGGAEWGRGGVGARWAKRVVNDSGGTAAATDFSLSAAGPTPISGPGGADGAVNAGSYVLSETGPAGYAAGAWSCAGGSLQGATVTVALGEH